MKETLWFLFLFNGRLNRGGFWIFFTPFIFLGILGSNQQETLVVNLFVMVCLVWIFFAIIVKRLHDINKSGWWSIISLIPFFGGLAVLALGFIKGSEGKNEYGNYRFLSKKTT